MKKSPKEFFQQLQVDPITGEYYVVIPEWVVNDLSWYEDTEIEMSLDGNEILMRERSDD
jgi:hypothetical protein